MPLIFSASKWFTTLIEDVCNNILSDTITLKRSWDSLPECRPHAWYRTYLYKFNDYNLNVEIWSKHETNLISYEVWDYTKTKHLRYGVMEVNNGFDYFALTSKMVNDLHDTIDEFKQK